MTPSTWRKGLYDPHTGKIKILEDTKEEKGGRMNIKDFLDKQRELDARIFAERGIEFDDNKRLIGLVNAIRSECEELMDGLNWKWWKNPKPLDREYLKEEAIDILHFLLSMFNALDMSAEEVYGTYMGKNEVNHLRQDGVVEGREDYKAMQCNHDWDLIKTGDRYTRKHCKEDVII